MVWLKQVLTEIGGSPPAPVFAIDDNMSATVYFDSSDSLYEFSSPAPTLYMAVSGAVLRLLPYKQILCECVLSTLGRTTTIALVAALLTR